MPRSDRATARRSALPRRLAATLLALAAPVAFADAADDVFVPYLAAGQRAAIYDTGIEHDRDGSRESQQVLTLGWSPAARWITAVYGAWTADDGAHYTVDEWTWLNHLQLTAPGAGPVDVGALCEIEHEHDRSEGTGLQCGPTLELDTDTTQWNLNLLLEKHFGADDPAPASLGYQWQFKRMLARHVELGAQGFGELGTWNRWAPASQQSHQLGPAVFAKWAWAGDHELQLDAAWLTGLGSGSPRDTLRLRVRQDF